MPSIPTINTIGEPFIELSTVDSTNNYALDKIQENLAAHGMVIFAHEQTAGKGQRGKAWNTATSSNIILSVILNTTSLSVAQQFPFSAAMALGAFDLFSKYAGDETKIKWTNDIYWRDRKAGGILIETKMAGDVSQKTAGWNWAVVGIGLNINQTIFPEHLPNPVSLQQITGKSFNPITLARELCTFLGNRFAAINSGQQKEIIKDYNTHLYKRGETVRLKKQNAAFYCNIEAVNERGELLVSGTAKDSFIFGEVEWIIS